jgi:hypothetical protein
MRSIVYAGLLFALLTGMGAVADKLAAENGGSELVTAAADPDTTGSIGPASLPLSGEQRGRIFEYLMRLPQTPAADVKPEAAAPLPSSVPLQDLPAGAVREVPQVQGYKFVKLDDRILLVSPATRLVVAQIPIYRMIE